MGLQFKEIAEEFNITTTALQQWRKDMGIPFTTKIIGSEENKMKKFASTGLSILVATGVAGIGGNEVKAAEQTQPKTPENSSTEQPAVKATQTTEQAITEKQQQVTEKQAIVDQKQQVADTAKKRKRRH